MKNSSNVVTEVIVTVTIAILLLSIMQWLSKSLTMIELFTGEQMMFIILGASSSPLLWHLIRKVMPYVIKRITTQQAGMEVRTVTRPTEASTIEPEPEILTPPEGSANEPQAGLLSQVSELREESQEVEPSYGHEVGREEEEKPAFDTRAKVPLTAPELITQESQQVDEDYSLEFTEEELRELRDLTKRIRELRRRLLAYT
ncbi:hypothetical protein J7L27_02830 [Candidatus Bathyarchaeota archaeon]|nr:hypothetical protein [Candidatus Bathyarchaeota archaeon]